MSYVTKNRNEDGGDTLVIGGKMIVEEGATVEGLGEAASGYTLPAATADTLGGVKVGSGLSIDGDGVLSANGSALPVATSETVGGVKVGGGLSVEEDGTLSADGYTLPTANADTLGGVKVGSGLSINEDGLLSANGGGVTPCESIADLGNDPTISDIVRSFNALLAAMRSVGLMKT